jgi:hypothetical protein
VSHREAKLLGTFGSDPMVGMRLLPILQLRLALSLLTGRVGVEGPGVD